MKKIILLFAVVLLTVSVNDIKTDSTLGRIIYSQNFTALLDNVMFLIDASSERPSSKPVKDEASIASSANVNSKKETSAANAATSIASIGSSDAQANQNTEENAFFVESDATELTDNKLISSQNLADNTPQVVNFKVDENKNTLAEVILPKNESKQAEIATIPTTETDIIEVVQEKTEKVSSASMNVAHASSSTPVKFPEKEISSLVGIEDWRVQKITRGLREEFTLKNLTDSQQSGKILFSIILENGNVLVFDNLNATYKMRYQVVKSYDLVLTNSMKAEIAKSNIVAFMVELQERSGKTFHKEIFPVTKDLEVL